MDDGGIIKVPAGHVWVECENMEDRNYDSLTMLGGPISKKLVMGKCTHLIWPLWRYTSFKDLDKYSILIYGSSPNSKVYSNDEIF